MKPEQTLSNNGVEQPPKSERAAHLKDGISPIFACIGTYKDFESEISKETHGFSIKDPGGDIDEINWAGPNAYVISEVNERSKLSKDYANCTALVVTGIAKDTGENIGFMTHQQPILVLRKFREQFTDDVSERIRELKERSETGTIDAVMAGGMYWGRPVDEKEYIPITQLVSEIVQRELGFEPYVITGPKTQAGGDSIFYDAQHRRIYIIRPKESIGSTANTGYYPRDIDTEKKKWESSQTGEEHPVDNSTSMV
jgi:hypothetical protein